MTLRMRARPWPACLALLFTVAIAHPVCGTEGGYSRWEAHPERSGTVQTPGSAGSRKQASRLHMEFQYRELRSRLDSLCEDSLLVPQEERTRFRRAMQAAEKVLAEAEERLDEMKHRESGAESRKWEALRARMERTLFGLNRYLLEAEARWFPVKVPAPPIPATGQEEL